MRQFKAGQLQTGSIYNISSSYALTASYALNGGTGVGGGNYIATGSVTASVSLGTGSFTITSGSSTFMFVSSSGNVGVGTTTPTYKLDVSGTIRSVGNLYVSNTAGQSAYIEAAGNANAFGVTSMIYGQDSTNTGYVYNCANKEILFGTNNLIRARLWGNGNFGIGTTTDAGFKLDVNGTSIFRSTLGLTETTAIQLAVLTEGNTRILSTTGGQDMILNAFKTRIEFSFGTYNIRKRMMTIYGDTLTNAGVVIGVDAINVTSSILSVESTTKGFLPPRTNLTSNIASPAQGLITYLTGSTNEGLYYYNSGSYQNWTRVLNNTGSQEISGSLTITGSLNVSSSATIQTLTVGLGGGNVASNTALGFQALNANTTAIANTMVGYQAGKNITTSQEMTSVGYLALQNNALASTAVGSQAMSGATSAQSVAVGANALVSGTGASNVAIGQRSLLVTTSGAGNTAIGRESGLANTTGGNNIFIGNGATGVSATESNRTWIGNSSTTSTWLAGNTLLGSTTNNNYRLQVTATGSSNSGSLFVGGTTIATGSIATTMLISSSLSASANSDVLVGLDINSSFNTGSFTGVTNFGQRISQSTVAGNNGSQIALRATDGNPGIIGMQGGGWNAIGIWGVGRYSTTSTPDLRIFSTGNVIVNTKLLINATADAGYNLDVNGTGRFTGAVTGPDGSSLNGIFFDGGGTRRIRPSANSLDLTDTSGNIGFRVDSSLVRIGQGFSYVDFVRGLNSMSHTTGATQIMTFTLSGQFVNHLTPFADIVAAGYAPSAPSGNNTTLRMYTTNTTSGNYGNIIISHNGTSKTGNVLIGTSVDAGYTLNVSGSTNIIGNLTVTGSTQLTALTASGALINGNITVLGTASFVSVTSSIVQVGASTITLNTNNPAVRFGGINVVDSGSFGTSSTGSLLWDSQNNRWIYSNPSGSTYDGGLLISGPRNTSGLGNEEGTTLNALMKGQGGDHITSSGIFEVSGSVGIGTSSPAAPVSIVSGSNFNQLYPPDTTSGLVSYSLIPATFALSTYINRTTINSNSNLAVVLGSTAPVGSGTINSLHNLSIQNLYSNGLFSRNLDIATYGGSTTENKFITMLLDDATNTDAAIRFRVNGWGNGAIMGISTRTGRSRQDFDFRVGYAAADLNTGTLAYRIFGATGNFGLNTETDAGFKLDVNGTARVNGNLTVSSTTLYMRDAAYGNSYIFLRNPNGIFFEGNATQNVGSIKFNPIAYEQYGVAINSAAGSTNPPSSAVLALNSTIAGFLPTRHNSTSAIPTASQGLMTYVTASATEGLYYYNSGSTPGWRQVADTTFVSASLSGSAGYVPVFTGANSVSSSVIFQSGSRIGIGTTTPGYALTVDTAGTDGISVQLSGNAIRLLGNAGSGNPGIQSTGIIHIAAPLNGTGGNEVLQVRKAAGANFIQYWANNGGTTLSTVDGNGNFAIRRTTATASLDVAGTTRISGSFNTATSGSILTVIGSGSAQPIFTVQGSQGELFSITDSLSGSLFSVNDISGLPILEVFSDNTTLIGNYQDPMLITTAKVVTTSTSSFTIYSLPTASYDTAFFEYSVRSGSNARAGSIMAMQLGTTVNFTETTTTDFGSTTGLALGVFVTGSNMILTGSATTTGWTIKTIVRGL